MYIALRIQPRDEERLACLAIGPLESSLYNAPQRQGVIDEYIHRFRTIKAETHSRLAVFELKWEYAHTDKISAMNAFEALGDDDVNAE